MGTYKTTCNYTLCVVFLGLIFNFSDFKYVGCTTVEDFKCGLILKHWRPKYVVHYTRAWHFTRDFTVYSASKPVYFWSPIKKRQSVSWIFNKNNWLSPEIPKIVDWNYVAVQQGNQNEFVWPPIKAFIKSWILSNIFVIYYNVIKCGG